MKYYRYNLDTNTKYGTMEVLQPAPCDILDILTEMPKVSNVKEISKSTFYRLRRQDAQAYWNALGKTLFEGPCHGQ